MQDWGEKMILYFSATGNSRYVAERIAIAIGTKAVSVQKITDETVVDAHGMVSPTYAWGIPSIVKDFLQTHKLKTSEGKCFYVATYGTTPGVSWYLAQKALKSGSDISFDAFYGVRMPDTWTPIFDLSDKEKVARINANAESQIKEIIHSIQSRAVGNFMKARLPAVTRAVYPFWYDRMRATKHLVAEDDCIGCGSCEKKCPVHAIGMREGKPVWIKKHCAMCLGCLHRCPKFAIRYGKKTAKHGQYQNPNVKT